MNAFAAGVVSFLLFAVPAGWAAVKETVSTDYYEIAGHKKKELLKEIKKKGVKDGGGRYHAHTDWRVTWNYRYAPIPGGCRVHSVSVSLDIRYFLPRWQPAQGVSEDLKFQWNRYFTALAAHEEGHADIGRRAAREIEEALSALGQGLSCGSIQAAADAAARKILDRYREEESRYDAATKNGRTQGAYLD